jgi:hypothetical protein
MSLTWNKVEDLVIQSKIHSDTRPIKRLIKAIAAYISNPDDDAMNHELVNYELILKKFNLQKDFSDQQNLEFKTLETLADYEILKIQDEIESLKSHLVKAQENKSKKIMYDSLAKSIKKVSSREKSARKMKKIEKEIQKLQDENNSLVKAKDVRKLKIEKLITLMHDIQDEICIVHQEKSDDVDDLTEDEEGMQLF